VQSTKPPARMSRNRQGMALSPSPCKFEDLSSSGVKHLVIIAGGKGTRLAPVAGDVPKVLVPIGGKPVLQHQLELAATAGISEVTIFAGYLGDRIEAFVGDGSTFGLRVRTLVENEPMGSAGALLRSLDALPDQFFVLYGDVMLAVDLRRIAKWHIDRGADFTALVHPNDHPQDSDLLEVDVDDWVTAIHAYPHPPDKFFGNLVNAALYVVRRDALRPCAAAIGRRDFVKDIMAELVAKGGRVLAYRSSEYVKDMGTPSRLKRVEADWQAGRLKLEGSGRSRPAVFLDRDGTLTVENGYLRTPSDLQLLPGVAPALRSLRHAGYRLVVLTNQPVIARGEASEADVSAVHRRLEWELGKEGAYLDRIYLCPHHPDRGFPGERSELKIPCQCRKPATGLFERACRDLHIEAAGSWMIGDQTRDIEMARRAGLRSILVQTGVSGRDGKFQAVPDYIADDLAGAVGVILRHEKILAL
jgi:histidinol-phosphate phosphatase family protein